MKLIGNLLLTICLITGCLSAATAYLVPASDVAIDPDEPLTLAEGAGAVKITDAERAELRAQYDAGEITAETYAAQLDAKDPIVEEGTELTEEDLARLEAADARYAEVKQFSIGRWPYGWVFGLSALGLLAGSLLVRAGAKAEIAASTPADAGPAAEPTSSPDAAVAAIAAEIESLRRDLPSLPSDNERLDAIVSRLGHLQGDQIPTFIEARAPLIARFGLGKYAEIMDRFAAMERKINRAWSAAADNHLPEATIALEDAASLTPGVAEALKS